MKKFQYLKSLFNFIILGLAITTLSRIILYFIFNSRVAETPQYWKLFFIGLRFDLILLCYLSFLPFVILTFVPYRYLAYFKRFINIYYIFFLVILLFMELATPNFIKQYDTRPNRIFLDYLVYPKEVMGTLVKSYLPSLLFAVVVVTAFIYFLVKKRFKVFATPYVAYKQRLILFPLIGFLLFLGARGSLTSKRPINASNAVFSFDQLTNCLGLNSFYTVAFAGYCLKNEDNAVKMYGKMDKAEAYNRVKKYMTATASDFTNPAIPLLHTQTPDSLSNQQYNVVIFLQESLGAEYVGSLGGLPLTPEFDKLTKEGLLFTNLYSTGTRSVRGIEAVVTGFLPSPSESVVKLSNSQSGFFSLADLFKERGYATSFIYGGMANFDNMASFFNGNGFEDIVDQDDFDADGNKYAFKGTWGYSDEDLVTKANTYFKNQKGKPFFSLMFSTSNHDPFEFPDGRIQLHDKKKTTVNNAIKYADFSIGNFFEMAKKEAYFKNTIFIVIADHNTRTVGKNLVPVNKFHIPALLIGPGIAKGQKYNTLCSQIDMAPSLLDRAGITVQTPMPGRDLFKLGNHVKGRAIMQFHDANAFRVDNQVVIMQPFKDPVQFKLVSDTEMIPVPLDPELAKDALAHVTAAFNLYNDATYKIPHKKETGN